MKNWPVPRDELSIAKMKTVFFLKWFSSWTLEHLEISYLKSGYNILIIMFSLLTPNTWQKLLQERMLFCHEGIFPWWKLSQKQEAPSHKACRISKQRQMLAFPWFLFYVSSGPEDMVWCFHVQGRSSFLVWTSLQTHSQTSPLCFPGDSTLPCWQSRLSTTNLLLANLVSKV